MSEAAPRVSSTKVTIAILAIMALTINGCTLFATNGTAYDVRRGPWELYAGLSLIVAGFLTVRLYSLAFKSRPAFSLHDDRVEHYSWKRPIYFRDIDEVVLESRSLWRRRAADVHLRLTNGSIQHIPYGLMTHGPEAFAEVLEAAVERFRANAVQTPPPEQAPPSR